MVQHEPIKNFYTHRHKLLFKHSWLHSVIQRTAYTLTGIGMRIHTHTCSRIKNRQTLKSLRKLRETHKELQNSNSQPPTGAIPVLFLPLEPIGKALNEPQSSEDWVIGLGLWGRDRDSQRNTFIPKSQARLSQAPHVEDKFVYRGWFSQWCG